MMRLPFTLTVPPGAEASVSLAPDPPMNVERLVIDTVLPDVFVVAVQVGRSDPYVREGYRGEQVISNAPIPVSIFARRPEGFHEADVVLKGDPASRQVEAVITFRNDRREPVEVSGELAGEPFKPTPEETAWAFQLMRAILSPRAPMEVRDCPECGAPIAGPHGARCAFAQLVPVEQPDQAPREQCPECGAPPDAPHGVRCSRWRGSPS